MVNGLAILFGELVIGVFIATLIGAIILQASCVLFNLLAGVSGRPSGRMAVREAETEAIGEPNPALAPHDDWADYGSIAMFPGVPKPSFERAMRIFFIAILVNAVASFIVFRLLRLAGLAAGHSVLGFLPIYLIPIPLGILVLAGMSAAMLPTTFGKGLLVSLLGHLLGTILAAVIVLIALAFGLSLARFS